MDKATWKLVNDLFAEAMALGTGSRLERWLSELADREPEAARELRELLEAHASSDTFLEDSALAKTRLVMEDQTGSRWIGRALGVWRIRRLIHQGGMGMVFLASRTEGGFEQTAALKVIRTELANDNIIERFQQERQMLARLDHPNISHLLDGGMTEEGLPWLAMEYVEGQPIDRWCDDQRLGISDRLKLFARVCDALAYAHRNLIIHRDIKPSNILVNAEGLPKLLDFGIAKLVTDGAPGTDLTVTSQRLLTPAYASPEQFLGQDISTVSDVYSLGMLFYELLVGTTPYRIEPGQSAVQWEELICRLVPPSPSRAVDLLLDSETRSRVAKARATSVDQLRKALRGDVDIIVMKCLRKEPERRYASVDVLKADLERFGQHLPIHARPDSWSYRAGKFVQRHWLGLGAAGAVMIALGTGMTVALIQSEQARSERDRAYKINQFLQSILIEADPFEAGADSTIREVLGRASDMITVQFVDDPDLEAALRRTIGYTQLSLMELEASESNLRRALALKNGLYGPLDDRTLQIRAHLAWLAYERGDIEGAEAAYREVIDQLPTGTDPDLRATITNDYGIILNYLERYNEAIEHFERAIALWTAIDPEHPQLLRPQTNLGYAYDALDEFVRAEHYYRMALEEGRKRHADKPVAHLAIMVGNLGILLYRQGRTEEAEAYYRESLQIRQQTLGTDHPQTGFGHLNLGRMLLSEDRPEDAREHLVIANEIFAGTLDDNHFNRLVARASLARVDVLDSQLDPAVDELADVDRRLQAMGAASWIAIQIRYWHADALAAAGRRVEAVRAVSATLELAERELESDDETVRELKSLLNRLVAD